jgi:hypothetical protein
MPDDMTGEIANTGAIVCILMRIGGVFRSFGCLGRVAHDTVDAKK